MQISDDLWLGTHDPKADWIYGLDVSVHPDYQGKGIGREIYNARQEVAKTLGCKGQMTAGMPIGFDKVKEQMTIAEYYRSMGLKILLLADSTSRWAQALREMSNRMEELPGQDAFPMDLP
ncbi:MAG: hypothetical protein RL262_1349, partial [Bacteroidota bacterium]